MKIHKILLWILLCMPGTFALNAQRTISGKVLDAGNNDPLIGASILGSDGKSGTITDLDGNFTLPVPNEIKEIEISYTGYQTVTVNLENGVNDYLVKLTAGRIMDEVIIVGYGEMRKSDVTGSVSKLVEDINTARNYSGVDELLQGRVAGVHVSANSGNPNGAISVNIRGTNSLRGNNEPLYVVDGVIINSAGEDVVDPSADANELQSAQNGLSGINPRDIKSIEILKDASATAIYGSRGANGVVLITTKEGKENPKGDEINAFFTITNNQVAKKIDMLDPLSFAQFQNDVREYQGFPDRYVIDGNEIFLITSSTDTSVTVNPIPLKQVDWQDEIYRQSLSYNTGFSMNGQRNNTKYYFSAGYSDIQGIVQTTKMNKGDLRLNLSTDVNSRLSLDNRIGMSYETGSFANGGSKSGGNRSFTNQILTYRPLIVTLEDESEDDLEISNPYGWLTDFDDLTKETRLNMSSTLKYKFSDNLDYQLRGGIDFRLKDREKWYGPEIFKGGLENGLANYSNFNRKSYTIDHILNYKKKINKFSRINATGAVTYDAAHKTDEIFEISDFPIKTLRSSAPQLGQLVNVPYTILLQEEKIFSSLIRINYSFKDKYVVTASFRADQSSKFAKGNQWGYFPSTAIAWRLSEEKFIRKLKVFDDFKLRIGWGKTGNQAISPYQTLSTYNTVYYADVNDANLIGSIPSRIPNPNLIWETTNQYNLGADISVLKTFVNLTIDAYYKRTDDLLQDIAIPPSTGFTMMTVNRGSLENKGLEFTLDAVLFKTKKSEVSMGSQISINRSKIRDLGLPESSIWVDGEQRNAVYYLGNNVSTGTYFKSPANIFMEGQPIGMFWGLKTNGIYHDLETALAGPTYKGNPNKAGDIAFVDQNGDGNIDGYDLTFIGNPNPDFTYGFDIAANYRNFGFKVLFDGVYGNDIANGNNLELAFPEAQTKNVTSSAYLNAWSAENPGNNGPRIGYSMQQQGLIDLIIEDGSYFRLNIITLSYDIQVKKSIFSKLNIYLSGRNLFYLTNYSGYEPQVTSFLYDGTIKGVDWVGTPNVRSFVAGINATF